MKKLLTLFLTLVILSALTVPAFASNSENSQNDLIPPADYGAPIQVTSYFDEDLNATVTERTYFVPDPISTCGDKSGRGWYKNEKTFNWVSPKKTSTYYAQGYFVWGDGDVSVSSPSGGYDWIPSGWYVDSAETTHGTGNYGYIFNKFAYVTYEAIIYQNGSSNGKVFSVTIRLSESGNMI